MRSIAPLQFLFIFCALCVMSIHYGLFDDLYKTTTSLDKTIEINYILLLFYIGTCIYRILDSWRLYMIQKVTQFDVYFLTVHNSFALVQLGSAYIVYTYFGKLYSSKNLIQPALLLLDWSLLPFFSWIALWSRHVQRGWNSGHNRIVFILSILSFFLVLLHQSILFYLFGLVITMSAFALKSTYNVHHHRKQISPLFFAIVLLHVIFLVTLSYKPMLLDTTTTWAYFYVTSFTLITSLTNRMHLRILIETNEHK